MTDIIVKDIKNGSEYYYGWSAEVSAEDVSYDNTTSGMTADNVQDALDEVFQSVSNGKELIADAITDKGVSTSATDSFATMAGNIGLIYWKSPEQTTIETQFNSLSWAQNWILYDGESSSQYWASHPAYILDSYKEWTYVHVVARDNWRANNDDSLAIRMIVIDSTWAYWYVWDTYTYMGNRTWDRIWLEYIDWDFYLFSYWTRSGNTLWHLKFDSTTKTFSKSPSADLAGTWETLSTGYPEWGRILTNVYTTVTGWTWSSAWYKDRVTFLSFS